MTTRRRRAVGIAKPVAGLLAAATLIASTLTADSVGAGPPVPTAGEARVACAIDPVLVQITTVLAYPGRGRIWASGVVFDSSGDVLTNNHVVAGAASIRLRVQGRDYDGTVVATDVRDDLALVRMSGAAGLPAANFASSPRLDVGQTVYAVGNGRGDCNTPRATQGTVAALGRRTTISDELNGDSLELTGLILSDVAVEPGYSGGALVDDRSQVVGILTAGHAAQVCDCYDRVYAIPSDKARAIAERMRAGVSSPSVHVGPTASLGIAAAPSLDASIAPYLTGALITYVAAGSPADGLGLEPGHEIVSIDGRRVRSALGLVEMLQAYHPGDTVQVGCIDGSGRQRLGSAVLTTGPPQ